MTIEPTMIKRFTACSQMHIKRAQVHAFAPSMTPTVFLSQSQRPHLRLSNQDLSFKNLYGMKTVSDFLHLLSKFRIHLPSFFRRNDSQSQQDSPFRFTRCNNGNSS